MHRNKSLAINIPDTEIGEDAPIRHGLFGLKRRAILMLGLALLLINATFSFLLNNLLTENTNRHMEQLYQQYIKQLNGLIKTNETKLQDIASLLPALSQSFSAQNPGNDDVLTHTLNTYWQQFNFSLGIELFQLYSKDSRLMAEWETPKLSSCRQDIDPRNIVLVNRTEQPVSTISCGSGCLQITLVPRLAQNEHAGLALLGTSIADIVTAFKQVTGTDIALIRTPGSCNEQAETHRRLLTPWNQLVAAATSSDQSMEILKNISTRNPIIDLDQGVVTEWNNNIYQVRTLPAQGLLEKSNAKFLVIEDISGLQHDIRNATVISIALGLVGLALSSLLLFAILRKPIARLQHSAAIIPKLAHKEYKQVRDSIPNFSPTSRPNDEFDVLDETILKLSYQLENLSLREAMQQRILRDQMADLAHERDFVGRLLDTAQVIIMTLNDDLRILSVNEYTTTLTGFDESHLIGMHIDTMLDNDDTDPDFMRKLHEIASGNDTESKFEVNILCRDNRKRHITWLHSRIAGDRSHAPVILSVGLDITDKKEAESRLTWLADHDPLTRLYNRRRFQAELNDQLAKSSRYGNRGAVLFLDLDNLKYINDTFGHEGGDLLLKHTANILEHSLRSTDVIARFGGDEFAVLLHEVNGEQAALAAQDITQRITKSALRIKDETLLTSASIGISLYPEHSCDTSELLAFADTAMYQVKQAGGGRYHLYSPAESTHERVRRHGYWHNRIRSALAESRFELHYQPIVHIASGHISHYEVLVRMLDLDGSLIFPGDFIPVAEHTGQIVEIDHFVITQAIRHLAELHKQGHDLIFEINISGTAIQDPGLISRIHELIQETGINPAHLVFELTETAAVLDFTATRELMEGIIELGCRFALDDFGAGFSSFFYLRELPLHYIKIDGSFIRDLPQRMDDQIIVKVLSEIARGFNKKTIAEFVEDEATLTLLHKFGVDYAQGYCIGKPSKQVPVESISSYQHLNLRI